MNIARLLPLTRIIGWLPASRRQQLAERLARRALAADRRRVKRARMQIAHCFPALSAAQQTVYLHEHFVHRYRLLLDLGELRYAPLDRIQQSIVCWEGFEWLSQQTVTGRGVIVATPHFGDWERFNLVMGRRVNAAVLYKPSGHAVVDRWLHQLRCRTGVVPVAVGRAGIKELLKRLQSGGVVGILPDQMPKQGQAVDAPFFGVTVPTMNLIYRLVQKTGCAVGMGACIATETGYQLKVVSAPPGIDDADATRSATALNRGIEQLVMRAPAQYLWTYRRW